MVSILADLADSARGGARVLRLPRRHPAFGEGHSPPVISALVISRVDNIDQLVASSDAFERRCFRPRRKARGTRSAVHRTG
jgi:hypothetical protein